jgi:hypothetical protein
VDAPTRISPTELWQIAFAYFGNMVRTHGYAYSAASHPPTPGRSWTELEVWVLSWLV